MRPTWKTLILNRENMTNSKQRRKYTKHASWLTEIQAKKKKKKKRYRDSITSSEGLAFGSDHINYAQIYELIIRNEWNYWWIKIDLKNAGQGATETVKVSPGSK